MQKNSLCRCPKVGKFFKTERLRQGSTESTLEGTKGTSKKGMSLIRFPVGNKDKPRWLLYQS